MTDERLRISCDADYLQAVGLAAFTFARLEWLAVCCAEILEPGCIAPLERRTAGPVADKLVELAANAPNHPLKPELIELAASFHALVSTRNAIVHAKPATQAETGRQLLFRYGNPWNVQNL